MTIFPAKWRANEQQGGGWTPTSNSFSPSCFLCVFCFPKFFSNQWDKGNRHCKPGGVIHRGKTYSQTRIWLKKNIPTWSMLWPVNIHVLPVLTGQNGDINDIWPQLLAFLNMFCSLKILCWQNFSGRTIGSHLVMFFCIYFADPWISLCWIFYGYFISQMLNGAGLFTYKTG